MSEAPPRLPPPSNSALLPTFAAVTYLAALVALWGLLSLALDRDVVDLADAGPLLGPAMASACVIVTWLILLAARRARSPWPAAVGALLLCYALMLVVATIGYDPSAAPHFAISPFILGAAALSGVTVLVTWAIHPRR